MSPLGIVFGVFALVTLGALACGVYYLVVATIVTSAAELTGEDLTDDELHARIIQAMVDGMTKSPASLY